MSTIDISLDQVRMTAERIEKHNTNLKNTLESIQRRMESFEKERTWESDAASTLNGKVKGLTPRFDEYNQVVTSYVKFLREVARVYDEAETTINSNASQFK